MKKILFCFLLLAATGCRKTLDITLPYEGNRLVIYGLLSPDRTVSVKIARTFPVQGKNIYEDHVVKNAIVPLFENGTYRENLTHTTNGEYVSPSRFKPIVGKSYHIKVRASEFPDAETLPQIVPGPVVIDSFVFREEIISALNSDTPTKKLTFAFTDNGTQVNYYNAVITGTYQGRYVLINNYSLDRPDETQDLCGSQGSLNNQLLKDICFNGNRFVVNVAVETTGFLQDYQPGDDDSAVACDRIVLSLQNVTKEYFDYLRQPGIQETGFLQIFEPVRREYTNVKGGYGIWGAYNAQTVRIQ